MKKLLLLLSVVLAAGCPGQQQSSETRSPSETKAATTESYALLKVSPDAILNEMLAEYPSDNQPWQSKWKQDNTAVSIDGQRTIRLLEVACYADVMCHAVEHPLRVATHDYIRENLDNPEVRNSLNWILTSYNSGLPLGAPDDDTGAFKGMLVNAMKVRMTEYANELIKSAEKNTERK